MTAEWKDLDSVLRSIRMISNLKFHSLSALSDSTSVESPEKIYIEPPSRSPSYHAPSTLHAHRRYHARSTHKFFKEFFGYLPDTLSSYFIRFPPGLNLGKFRVRISGPIHQSKICPLKTKYWD